MLHTWTLSYVSLATSLRGKNHDHLQPADGEAGTEKGRTLTVSPYVKGQDQEWNPGHRGSWT